MGKSLKRLGESLRAASAVFANPDLRRLQGAWAASNVGGWAYGVTVLVYAYEHDGTAAVGVVSFVRMFLAAIAAPLAAVLADRHSRVAVMVMSDLARVVALAAAALAVFAGAPSLVVYGLSVVVSVATTGFRPAQAALLPSIAHTPEELTAANVVSSTIEGTGIFVGPALGGLLLVITGTGVVFLVTALSFLWSALLVARIRGATRAAVEEDKAAEPPGIGHEVLAGVRAITSEPRVRLVVGLLAAQTLVSGALNVLIVVAALRLVGFGEAGVGYLTSAIGVGGILGSLAVFGAGRRLALTLAVGIVLWGLPLALVGLWPNKLAVLVLLGVVGIGNTLVDVAGLTLLQRSVPDAVLARVFGVLESLMVLTIGLGALAAPALTATIGDRAALIVAGAFLPALALVFWPRLLALDADTDDRAAELALLRGIPLFAPLGPTTLETLARKLEPATAAAGATLIREGEEGDRFYLIRDGEVEVAATGRPVARLGPGDFFGEIALLQGVPRVATVTARTDASLYTLERDDFVAAVTGHPETAESADAVIATRLAGLRGALASV